jgi:hypothetical protein
VEHPPVINTEDASFEIAIKNENSVPISFLEKKAFVSCTCMSFKMDSYNLQPGEQTVLKLKSHLMGRHGPFSMTINIMDSLGRNWEIKSKTFVYAPSQFAGDELNFGTVEEGKEFERNVIYKQAAKTEKELPASPKFLAKIAGVELLDTQEKIEKLTDKLFVRTTNFKFKVKIPAESFRENIQLTEGKINVNDFWQPMSLSWKVKREIEFSSELYLPTTGSQIIERKVYLRFSREFNNLVVKSSNPAVTCKLDYNKNSGSGFVTIAVDTTKLNHTGNITENLTFEENGNLLPVKMPYTLVAQ